MLHSVELLLAFFLLTERLDVCTKKTCKHKIFFIFGIQDVVSSKSQDTMIVIAWKAFFLYRRHKGALKLPGATFHP